MTITIGPWTSGEVPEPIEYSFLDSDGTAIDLTGYTATFQLKIGEADALELDADVDEDAGTVTHTWVEGELERTGTYGTIRAGFWVSNGTNTYASEPLVGFLRRALVAEVAS